MSSPPQETGLIIPVPGLNEFVRTWRTAIEAMPPQGAPAHITVMYPFLEPSVAAAHSQRIAEMVADHRAFEFELTKVGWFDDDVVYLEPQPAELFAAMTHAVTAAWPNLEPYGGEFEEVVPHLTLGAFGDGLERAAVAAEHLLPFHATAREVWLMEGCADPPDWSVAHRFEMGSA